MKKCKERKKRKEKSEMASNFEDNSVNPEYFVYALNFCMLGTSDLSYACNFRTATDRRGFSDLLFAFRMHFIFVRKPPCMKYTKVKCIRNILDLQQSEDKKWMRSWLSSLKELKKCVKTFWGEGEGDSACNPPVRWSCLELWRFVKTTTAWKQGTVCPFRTTCVHVCVCTHARACVWERERVRMCACMCMPPPPPPLPPPPLSLSLSLSDSFYERDVKLKKATFLKYLLTGTFHFLRCG